MEDLEDPSEDEEDRGEEWLVITKEEGNVGLAKSMDTCPEIVHNQFAIFATKPDMQR